MAVEQFSKSDKEGLKSATDSDANEGAGTWRDYVVDISGLWDVAEVESEVNPERRDPEPLMTAKANESFWRMCDQAAGPGREPDWEEHLKTIDEARKRGLPGV